jgi:hypothetical protein
MSCLPASRQKHANRLGGNNERETVSFYPVCLFFHIMIIIRHLYAQYLAIDANFRMKQKERGFQSSGTLGPGWGYFVNPMDFSRELLRVSRTPQIQQKSTCDSAFAAIERANSRANQGFAVTGIVGVIDSRHGLLLPNAVADLQKGERYAFCLYFILFFC